MEGASAYVSYKFFKNIIQYGFLVLSIIDSALVFTASRLKIMENIGGFPGWLKLHYEYGVWKVNTVKIMISIIIPYPELALSPRVGLLFFYLVHVVAFSYKLVFRCIKKE